MNVKELIELLKDYPEDLEVVYDKFEDDGYNFIGFAYIEENKLHLME